MDKQIKRVRHAADKTTESGGLEGRRLSRTRSSVRGWVGWKSERSSCGKKYHHKNNDLVLFMVQPADMRKKSQPIVKPQLYFSPGLNANRAFSFTSWWNILFSAILSPCWSTNRGYKLFKLSLNISSKTCQYILKDQPVFQTHNTVTIL